MSNEPASFLGVFRAHLGDWFERASPAQLGRRPEEEPVDDEDDAGELLRRSVHEVTLEQLGLAHWSCHSHF